MFSNPGGGGPRWRWYLKVDPNTVPPGCTRDAYAETFDEAKAAVERNWRIWLERRGLWSVNLVFGTSCARSGLPVARWPAASRATTATRPRAKSG